MPHERSNTYVDQKVDLEALHDASRDKRVYDRIKVLFNNKSPVYFL